MKNNPGLDNLGLFVYYIFTMNKIQTLVTLCRISEAYGATLTFKRADLPILITLPSIEVVHCFTAELLNICGILADDVNLCQVTVNL